MEIQTDQGLLVVNLDNCISDSALHELVKGDCIYTLAVSNGDDASTVLQIPVTLQCNGNLGLHTFNNVPVSQLQQESHTSQQFTQQQFEQVQIVEQLQCLLERGEQNTQLVKPQESCPSIIIDKLQPEPSNLVDIEQSSSFTYVPTQELELDYKAIYNYINRKTIPFGASENFKRMLKKKSQQYAIIDQTLYHGSGTKKLKKVVIDQEAQDEILRSSHIEKDSGIHLGVRKMHSAIMSSYYWIGMYMDVTNFVRQCEGCCDTVVENIDNTSSINQTIQTENCNMEQANPNAPCSPTHFFDEKTNQTWQKVEAQMYGPFPKTVRKNEFLMTISDPISHWIRAVPIPDNNHETRMANFIFETFCTFGFAKCTVVDSSAKYFEVIQRKYKERAEQITEIDYKLHRVNSTNCLWAKHLIDSVTSANRTDWDQEQEKFLYKFRSTVIDGVTSPFSLMFQRSPNRNVEEGEEKENFISEELEDPLLGLIDDTSKRRRLQCSILQCRHCEEVFTSKISFRIHQRKHTEDAKRRGTLDGQEPLKPRADFDRRLTRNMALKKKKKLLRRRGSLNRVDRLMTIMNRNNNQKSSQQQTVPKDGRHAELKANTVAAVRKMLASTKDERRRRGKYQKYPSDVQDEMAHYAIEHGIFAAVKVFTKKLGTTVSESTIRNIVKLHRSYTPEIKEEIGRYAAAFGIEAGSTFFTERLGREIRQGLVRKFKKLYMRKFPDVTSKPQIRNEKTKVVNSISSNGKQKTTFSPELRDEIGGFACQFSVPDTVEHFSQNLNILLKKNTVRKFRKMFMAKHETGGPVHHDTALQQQILQVANSAGIHENVGPSTSQTIDILNASLTLLNNPQLNAPSPVVYNHLYQSGASHSMPVTSSVSFHPVNTSYSNIPTTMSVSFVPQQHPLSVSTNQNHHDSNNRMHSFQNSLKYECSPFVHEQQALVTKSSSFSQYSSELQPITINRPQTFSTGVANSQQTYHRAPTSLLLSNQHLVHLPRDKLDAQPIIQLPNRNVTKSVSMPISLSDEFEEGLCDSSAGMSFVNPISTLISDQTGTYSLTSTLNPIEPLVEPIMEGDELPQTVSRRETKVKLQHESSEDDILSQDSEQMHSLGTLALNDNLLTKPPAFTTFELDCDSLEEDVDDPDFMIDMEIDDPSSPVCVRKSPAKKKGKKSMKNQRTTKKEVIPKRGTYTTYSPEIRAKMGKYAAEHGSQSTCVHFRSLLGHDIPESTVRGLRDKYLLKCEQISSQLKTDKEVTSLGYSPRGRPMRLGKYDQVVQECIRELVKSGEKVSSFLAIATAKQVLMQYEPNLLEENGGTIKLNTTWAKSFLKRIGIHNNS